MADDDGARAQAGHEALQALQSVEVEVVGGLVEQEDVVAREEQRGEARAGRLSAGERGHGPVEAHGQAQLGGDLLGPLLQVRAAEGEPALQGLGVRVVRARGARDQGFGRLVHRALGVGDAGAAGQERGHRLTVATLGLLREVADGGGGRGEPQLALLRAVEPGEQPEQGRFARAVDSDETDHVTGGDDEVEPGEERAVAVSGGEVLGDESGSHQEVDPNRRRSMPIAPCPWHPVSGFR